MSELQTYIRIILKNWMLVGLVTMMSVTVALATAYATTPTYRTSAQFIVSPGDEILAGVERDIVRSIEALDRRSILATYAEIMGSRRLYERAGEAVGLTSQELRTYKAKAVVLPTASALDLTVSGPDPLIAARLANRLGEESITYIQSIYQVYDVNFLDTATVPGEPVAPVPIRDAGVAAVLGAMAGAILALLQGTAVANVPVFNRRRQQMAGQPELDESMRSAPANVA